MTDALPLYPGRAPGALGDAPADRPTLTPFLLPGGPRGCVVVCPGGGYAMKAEHEGAPIARWLNAIGVAACVLDYRVAPYRHPIPVADARRAIRTVRANAAAWRIDPAKVGILGFSAGGHLAASASTLAEAGDATAADPVEREPSRPDAAILCYPVITFGDHRHDGSMRNLLGPEPLDDQRRALSLETRVTPRTPPTFSGTPRTTSRCRWPTACSTPRRCAPTRCRSPCTCSRTGRTGSPWRRRTPPSGPGPACARAGCRRSVSALDARPFCAGRAAE